MTTDKEQLLDEVHEYILECPEVFAEADAGQNGDGLFARILMHYGMSFDDANHLIFSDEFAEEVEDDR